MIRVLTGDNTFTLRSELNRLVDAFVADYTDMGLERLDGEEISYDRIREALQSLPFLASKKMVLLQRPSANKEFLEKATQLLDGVPETTDVLIVEPKLDKRLSYYKFLKKNSDYKEFTELDENGLSSWLVQQAQLQGSTLKKEDARYLVQRVGIHQQLLSSELLKLLTYDPQISKQTIDLLTNLTPQSTIFELLDAALAGRTKQALGLYQEQRGMKVEPQQIMAMLAWQLHILAVVKVAGSRDANTIAKEARLNPYVVRKTQGLVQRMPLSQIKKLVHHACILDTRLKSEPIDADEALQHLIMTI
ncbi:MAG TPA: DNA polymerase III subunit delta [Verrucomicrobiae bacterium]|nr:DNA polymerase III subunit delta [Verrucomicrobiae bacterium]